VATKNVSAVSISSRSLTGMRPVTAGPAISRRWMYFGQLL
jgi:hypothetical protein